MKQMFDPNFMNNLQQALGDNPWLAKSTNHNYKTRIKQNIWGQIM
jgi:hypothetical protein